MPLRTARLVLRPLALSDIDALLAYRGQPETVRYVPFEPGTRAELLTRLRTDLVGAVPTDEGQALKLGVEVAATGELVGDVVLFWHSRQHRAGEIGYLLHPDHQGRGYATEAAAALLTFAFDVLGLHRVVARVDARNTASARVARRLWMRQEAHLVENEWFKGGWADELVFAVLEDEWRTARRAADGPAR
ncbi:GNAT family N-acetyltransferase [Frankia nepalensis]|uniref:GNAT family N-acetyltransferase n=1 Tax=Frankia nepalensis TaxID=1836974 RepID=UPI001EE4B87B|nr:GNAT family protein [Frankia nepalensis]